jgi:hypothetical protein
VEPVLGLRGEPDEMRLTWERTVRVRSGQVRVHIDVNPRALSGADKRFLQEICALINGLAEARHA